MKRCIFFVTVLSLVVGTSLMAQVRVRMDLDTSTIFIGDHLGLTINVVAPQGTTVKSINYGNWADAGNLEVLEQGKLNTVATEPELLLQQRLLFTTFDSGYHRLPPLEVIYELNGITDTANSSNLGLTVVTIPVQEEADIMDNKDIIREPINWTDFMPYVLGLLLIVIILGIIWRASTIAKRKTAPPVPPPPPVPAHLIALEKLEKIAAAASWKQGDIKGFQSDVTYVLREYLENRFGMPALEATTPEITKALKARQLDQDDHLRQVLATADMVKFAKAVPAEEVHVRSLNQVREFVVATQEKEEPILPPTTGINAEEE